MSQNNPSSKKVIHSFKVEIVDCETCPELLENPSNPYINLPEEERIKDLVDIFGILWAETCRKNPDRRTPK
ncbi:MAG: hypothetical protein HQL12_04705 [Candidatus Omnitrophica bacterium]|nr:hypothetical protein [Candidatus Omnitrophota bacterium]